MSRRDLPNGSSSLTSLPLQGNNCFSNHCAVVGSAHVKKEDENRKTVSIMSAPLEEDSQMLSSPDESDNETTTPINQTANTTQILSPPDSQHRETRSTINTNMPTSASGSSIANSNGKRPLQTISNGADDMEGMRKQHGAKCKTRRRLTLATELQAMANGKARADQVVKTHPSGYQYSRAEDEPGYVWLNKKAQEEYQRAWESLSHKDSMVKSKCK